MNGLRDFVSGGYPLPWMPVYGGMGDRSVLWGDWAPAYDGMGEFVPGGFPLPQNPVFFASSRGSLPKAPDIPMALIAHGNGHADCGMTCGCGGSCESCGGMGALMIGGTDLSTLIPGQTFGISNTYLVAGGLLAALLFMGGSTRRGRR